MSARYFMILMTMLLPKNSKMGMVINSKMAEIGVANTTPPLDSDTAANKYKEANNGTAIRIVREGKVVFLLVIVLILGAWSGVKVGIKFRKTLWTESDKVNVKIIPKGGVHGQNFPCDVVFNYYKVVVFKKRRAEIFVKVISK